MQKHDRLTWHDPRCNGFPQVYNGATVTVLQEHERMTKLNIALVGAGFMGQFHALAIAGSDVAELKAVVDLSEAAGAKVAAAHGARYFKTTDDVVSAGG